MTSLLIVFKIPTFLFPSDNIPLGTSCSPKATSRTFQPQQKQQQQQQLHLQQPQQHTIPIGCGFAPFLSEEQHLQFQHLRHQQLQHQRGFNPELSHQVQRQLQLPHSLQQSSVHPLQKPRPPITQLPLPALPTEATQGKRSSISLVGVSITRCKN